MRRTAAQQAAEALEHLDVLHRHAAEGSWSDQVMVDAVCLRLAAAIDAAPRLSEAVRATVEHDLPRFHASLAAIMTGELDGPITPG